MRGARPALVAAGAALVAAAAVAAAAGGDGGRDAAEPQARAADPPPARAMRVRGNVRGLRPGVPRRLVARVINRTGARLVVREVGARALSASGGCPPDALRVATKRVRRHLGPRQRIYVRLRARLAASAPNTCQGARFELRFRARGEPA